MKTCPRLVAQSVATLALALHPVQAGESRLAFTGPNAPAILENALIKVVVDPGRGGTVSSYLLKSSGIDLTATWADAPVGQGFGLCIDRLVCTQPKAKVRDYETSAYAATAVDAGPDSAAVRVTGISPSAVGRLVQFSKVYRVRTGSTELTVDLEVANLGQTPVIASVWTCSHVRAGDARQELIYFYPTPGGVRTESYTRDPKGDNIFVRDAPQPWMAALREPARTGLAAAMDYASLGTLYTFMPGRGPDQEFPTLEWWTRRLLLKPVAPLEGADWAGKPFTTHVSFMPLTGLARVDGYANGLAAAIGMDDRQVTVSLLSARQRRVNVKTTVKRLGAGQTTESSVDADLPAGRAPVLPVMGELPEQEAAVVHVTVYENKRELLVCERAFGTEQQLEGYAVAPAGEKLPEPEPDLSARLTRRLVTPHTKWATPSGRPPLRVLFMVRSNLQREVVELAQRMDLDFTVIPTQYSHFKDTTGNAGLMAYYPGLNSIEEFHKRLEKETWDAVCIASRFWTLQPEKTRALLFDRVRAGMALINVNPRYWQRLPDVCELFRAPVDEEARRVICAPIPFAELPTLRDDPVGARWVSPLTHGKGRIVLLNYSTITPHNYRGDMTSLLPAPGDAPLPEWPAHEYYYSLLARAFLWATGRLPTQPLCIDGAVNGVLDADVPLGTAPKLTVRVPDAGPESLLFRFHAGNGAVLDAGSVVLPAPAASRGRDVALQLPAPTSVGTVFLDVWTRREERVEDWASIAIRVRSPVVQHVTLSVPDTLYEPGRTEHASIAIEARTSLSGAALELTVTDARDRVVARQTVPTDIVAGSSTLTVPFRLDHVLTVRHRLEVRLRHNAVDHGVARAVLYARQPPRAPDFTFLVWSGIGPSHLSSVARAQLRGIGLTDYQIGTACVRDDKTPTNAYVRARCDEILRDDMAIGLMNVNWVGGYASKDNPNVRKWVLDNPGYTAKVRERIPEKLAGLDKMGVRTASTGDEISIGRYSGFNDFCQSPHTVAAFREWLAERFGDIATLNREWETDYAAFADIPGITWADVEDRPNKAAWVCFRTYMEVALCKYLALFRDVMRDVAPDSRTGFDGTTQLCSYNGFDWWRISGVIDSMTGYRTAALDHFLGSFFRARGVSPHFSMWCSFSPPPVLRRRPLELLFRGMTGVDYWYEPLLLNPDFTLNESARALGTAVLEIQRGIGTLILSAERERDPVAILYSQPSVHAATIEGHANRPGPNQLNADYFAWAYLTEDAGLTAEFVSYEQLAEGHVQRAGYRALILPLCYALSDREIGQIRKFVNAGGVLIADVIPGAYNEHGRKRAESGLNDLFGARCTTAVTTPSTSVTVRMTGLNKSIEIPWGTVTGGIEFPDAVVQAQSVSGARSSETEFGGMIITSSARARQPVPAVARAERGRGHAYLLNLPVWRYDELRGSGRAQDIVAMLLEMLGGAAIVPRLPVRTGGRPAPALATARFAWGTGLYVSLVRAQNSRSPDANAELHWDVPGVVYNVRERKLVGRNTRATRVRLAERDAMLLARLPYEVRGLRAPGAVEAHPLVPVSVTFTVETSSGPATHHVLQCTVTDPQGHVRDVYSRNTVARDGAGTYMLTLALNDPAGTWRLRAEDVVSGAATEVDIAHVVP